MKMEQHYAVSKAGVLSSIQEAHVSSEEYFCPHCGCHMLKKCGKIRTWHFAHDYRYATEVQRNCSYETYLHGYAKLRIKEWFYNATSIIIHYNKTYKCADWYNCIWRTRNSNTCEAERIESFDLKKHLKICDIEKDFKIKDTTYRPDLLWKDPENQNNFIFIEIKVSHECSDKKKNSGARIIEFEINSEDDVDKIINNDIRQNQYTTYYGFDTSPKIDKNRIYIKPVYHLRKFILYKTGNVYANKKCTCQDYNQRHKTSLFEITIADTNVKIGHFFNYSLAAAINLGYTIKNCIICEHKKYQKDTNCTLCTKKNIKIESGTDAVHCTDFKLCNDTYLKFKKNLSSFAHFNKIQVIIYKATLGRGIACVMKYKRSWFLPNSLLLL